MPEVVVEVKTAGRRWLEWFSIPFTSTTSEREKTDLERELEVNIVNLQAKIALLEEDNDMLRLENKKREAERDLLQNERDLLAGVVERDRLRYELERETILAEIRAAVSATPRKQEN